jgi:replicative DNA helicase
VSDALAIGRASEPELERIDLGVLARIKAEKLRPLDVVKTPWPTWNRLCGNAGGGEGLAHGWHVIVGASSGAGKSLCATNMAAAAVRNGEHVCLISLEMSQEEIVTRLMAIYADEEIRRLEHGRRFDRDAWDRAADAFAEARGSLRVNHEPVGTLGEIMLAMRKGVDAGCRTFIVDYVQLAWVRDAETMIAQITEVSHTIRLFAKQNRVLTIGLSQVNRQTSGTGGELRKEGLLGGSSLENDADQVVLLGKPKPDGAVYRSEVKLDKNRQGPPGDWAMILDPRTLRMRDVLPDEEASRPA